MLIAASAVAAGFLASSAAVAVNPSPPPIVVRVTAAPNVPSSVVAQMLEEVDAIYRNAGIVFAWRGDGDAFATLRVVIGNGRGAAHDGETPLGWIIFEDSQPTENIHVSYTNAERFMDESVKVSGSVVGMTRFEHDMILGRIAGRALAHELGHYLLATKAHTRTGLMKASRSAHELVAIGRTYFQIDPAQRAQMLARQQRGNLVAAR